MKIKIKSPQLLAGTIASVNTKYDNGEVHCRFNIKGVESFCTLTEDQYEVYHEYEPKMFDLVKHQNIEYLVVDIVGDGTIEFVRLTAPYTFLSAIPENCQPTGRNLLESKDSQEMTIKEADANGLLKVGYEVWVKTRVKTWDSEDTERPVELEHIGGWVDGKTKIKLA